MGSGKRSNKKRPHAFTLGGFKEKKEEKKANKKDVDSLVEMWESMKKKKNNSKN